ncbi:MAG TPA: allantoinase AllB [Verrucomicrobiae bacterium]|jgi:allantoinase|nr:allantoinase AllB [Verrucomicrobiae bacterium]
MNSFDTVIAGGSVVTPEGVRRADLGIVDGRIAALEPELPGANRIDAAGCHIFPGVIDAHVHFNEPGRTEWEGIATGSAAVAAGGGTMFFDMPLNAHPPTLDAASFRLKQEAAEAKSVVDFALWGGLTPGNLDQLGALADCGVIGFKAFMCGSGIDDFASADTATLRAGMKRAAALGLLVAVHAESDALTARRDGAQIRDYLNSRPIAAETEAIRLALDLAGETGCALHVVHVSSAAGVRLISEARSRGVDATCETCPHYLILTDEDVERLGAVAKCAPPLRTRAEQEALWRPLLAGEIATVGSDHSPSPPEMKKDADFFKVWGGISGAQHVLPLLRTRGMEPSLLAKVTSANVAQRFNLPPQKGSIAVGTDADLALVELNAEFEVTASDLQYRHRQSPYLGRRLRGVVRRTLVRGATVFHAGKIVSAPRGRLIRPVVSG